MTAPLTTTDELVAIAWLTSVAGVPVGGAATTAPDVDLWPDGVFHVVESVGGSTHPTARLESPVITVHVWAARPNSDKPQWGRAAVAAQRLVDATKIPSTGLLISVPRAGFDRVRIYGATAFGTKPRRMPGDVAGYARYIVDIQIQWTPESAE